MDWLKRLIADASPGTKAMLGVDPEYSKPTPVAAPDLSTPDNTGIRNLLATINQNRDPQSLQLDPQRMNANSSFPGMNQYPMDIAPMSKMMPEQMAAIPTEAPMSKMGEAPPVAPTPKKKVASTPSIQDKSTTPVAPKEDTPKEDVLQKLGLNEASKPLEDEEMKAAQKQKADNMLLFNLNKAFNQIGSGIGQVKYDPTHGDYLKDAVDQPVTSLKETRAAAKELEQRDRDRQRFIMDKADFKNKQEMQGIDIEKGKLGLADAKEKNDPNSEASKLARMSTRDTLLRMGRKDLAAGVKDNMTAENINSLFGTMSLSNMVTAYEAQQSRLEAAKMRAHEASLRQAEKMDQKDIQRLDQASKLIDAPIARMNTTIGKLSAIVSNAGRVRQLIAGQRPEDVTNQQLYEMARAVDAMVSQGASTISGTEHLLPKGWKADFAKLDEKAKNKPVGAGQGAYVTQLMHTVDREEKEARKQMSEAAKASLGSYMDLATKHPESWKTMLQNKGLDPSYIANIPGPGEPTSAQYNTADELGINAVMKANNIDRDTAIKALKDAGKLK